jgi:prolyl-tRNA synthetase
VAIQDKGDFYDYFTPRNLEKPEIHGGFALSDWCGDPDCEARIKEDLTVTIRCLPFDAQEPAGRCISCGKPGQHRAVFAKAY